MIRRNLLVSFLASTIFSWQGLAQNVEELVNGHLEAGGGSAKLKALKSIKLSGKISMPMMMQNTSAGGSAAEAPVTVEIKKPNLVRMEIDVQGKPLVQAFDGETCLEFKTRLERARKPVR